MRGFYKFYQNGELIHEGENLITTNGKVAIQRYLAGISGHFGRSIRLGIGATAAAVGDTALEFEVANTPVYLVSPDFTNTALIFKGRLDAGPPLNIYEIGLSSAQQDNSLGYGSRVIFQFEQNEAWSTPTNVVWTTGSARFGSDWLRFQQPASQSATSTLTDLALDFSGYSDNDIFKLAYNPQTSFTSSIVLKFATDASNYYTYTINTPSIGFKVAQFTKANFVATGSPSWANITSASITVTSTGGGGGQTDFEGLRIDDKDTYVESEILVSRYVPAAPVAKISGQPLDIEYTLDLTL